MTIGNYSLSNFKGSKKGHFAAILRAENDIAGVLFRDSECDVIGYVKGLSFAPVQWMLEMTEFPERRPESTVCFYPLFQFGSMPAWDDDLTEEQLKDDQYLLWKMASHIKEVSSHSSPDQLKELWEEHGAHTSVCMLAQPFNVMDQPSGFVPERRINEYKVPESVLAAYRGFLADQFGEENVFVNPQVQTMASLLENWPDFATQAQDRLVEGIRYRRPMYDVQEVRDDIITVPIYGFSVGIRREWPHMFTVSDYLKRLQSLHKIDVNVPGIKDMMLEVDRSVFMVDTSLYGLGECRDIYDSFYKMVESKINQARWENRSWFMYKWACIKKRFRRLLEGQLST